MDKNLKRVNVDIGGNMRKFRVERNLNQEQFAELMGLTKSTIINIEHGRQSLTPNNMFQACYILGVNPNDLFSPIPKSELTFHKTTIVKEIVKNYFKPKIKRVRSTDGKS